MEVFTLQRDIPTQIPIGFCTHFMNLSIAHCQCKDNITMKRPGNGSNQLRIFTVGKEAIRTLLAIVEWQFQTNEKTRMHSSRMRTTRSLTVSRIIRLGGSAQPPRYSGCGLPPPPPPPPPWTEGMTQVCENITLPQTSFVGGNYDNYVIFLQEIVLKNTGTKIANHLQTISPSGRIYLRCC